MAHRALFLIALAGLAAGCSKTSGAAADGGAGGQAVRAADARSIKMPNGIVYAVERVKDFDASKLPSNSDLKMADGDLAKYAVKECSLDVATQYAPDRCDVYVQPDSSGTLVGYTFVMRDEKGARFQTATRLNEEKQSGSACYLSGMIYDEKENYGKAVADPTFDFNGRQMYGVTKNRAGNDLVSDIDPNAEFDDPAASLGVWYIKKSGDKLRINQERWNYCYKDADVYVDDVFYRAVSLKRVSS